MMRLLIVWFLVVVAKVTAVNVTYDHRALIIDGRPRVLVSGSIHYPRSTPDMWPGLIQKSKEGGLDVIETYIFWNLHEPVRNQNLKTPIARSFKRNEDKYDFEGRKDLIKFVKLVANAGLYVHLRIGPYISAEWNYGGFPLWLHFIPGIVFRTDNEPFKAEMKRFVAKIVGMMKEENLYASQGGPIILSQIENEYGNIDSPYGPAAKSYIKWAANMATSLDTGVPWVMCQQRDAPDPIIDTCNAFYCDGFKPNAENKPTMWTENWTGWFLLFGEAAPYRPVEDIAFAVTRFYQRGGTFQNYYMYHGGTNFGRTTGGPFIATSYDYNAPLDEYGMANNQLVFVYLITYGSSDPFHTSCNKSVYIMQGHRDNLNGDANVNFNGNSYHLPAWSVSILSDCKNLVFNTAKINSMATIRRFVATSVGHDLSDSMAISSKWSYVSEPVGISSNDAFNRPGLVEQINTTADQSDYLWYSISIDVKGAEPFLHGGFQTTLHVKSLGHVLHLFVNGQLEGSANGNMFTHGFTKDFSVVLKPGKNKLDLLSLTVGLQHFGAFFDKAGAGVTGPVKLEGLTNGSTVDLSSQRWTYQIGLKGESLGLNTGGSSLWVSGSPKSQPLTWYKTNFDAPAGDNPIAIDFTGMGKGEAWVNGQSIGRYWPSYIAPTGGCSVCSYKGPYNFTKCLKNCGKPSQNLYHVPRSWLKPSANVLVMFEEIGGDPTQISFKTQELESLCSQVSESHPLPMEAWSQDDPTRKSNPMAKPRVLLECPDPNQVISSIKFASFGTPQGKCGSFSHGYCKSSNALSITQKACIGSRTCNIEVSSSTFGDPCVGVVKSLAVEASCA
ncbi:hypothetical protein M8C21_023048 [Ambrosia artemisiifolia]|uniref:Beta-galactosidase n=1 Tax=Ambrosia artemisiifolia TaxID=4212 RepID=A0AAD5BYB1_AMBAR|nr:hypothetical protein M8C21_023048 [Ambrosia artemisiifolia]